MKWFLVLIVLALAGYFIYKRTQGPPQAAAPTSPIGAATMYIDAAYADDAPKIRSLCTSAAADRAIQVAGEIRAAGPAKAFKWQNTTSSSPDREAVTSVSLGRPFTMEFVKEGDAFKIAAIDLAQ